MLELTVYPQAFSYYIKTGIMVKFNKTGSKWSYGEKLSDLLEIGDYILYDFFGSDLMAWYEIENIHIMSQDEINDYEMQKWDSKDHF